MSRRFPIRPYPEVTNSCHAWLLASLTIVIIFSFAVRSPEYAGYETILYALSCPFVGVLVASYLNLLRLGQLEYRVDKPIKYEVTYTTKNQKRKTVLLILVNIFIYFALGRSGSTTLWMSVNGLAVEMEVPANCFQPKLVWTDEDSACTTRYTSYRHRMARFRLDDSCPNRLFRRAHVYCNGGLLHLLAIAGANSDTLIDRSVGLKQRQPPSLSGQPMAVVSPKRSFIGEGLPPPKHFHFPWELDLKDFMCLIVVPFWIGFVARSTSISEWLPRRDKRQMANRDEECV